MSFRRLSEEEEDRIAARWQRARRNWRFLKWLALAFLLPLAISFIYYAGEYAGVRQCLSFRPSDDSRGGRLRSWLALTV
jgi:hypothetical protein